MSTYYKVVGNVDGVLQSAWLISDGVVVNYKIGEWARSRIKGSKLFVFSKLESARRWIDNTDVVRDIYRCEVRKSKLQVSRVDSTSWCMDDHDVERTWRQIRAGDKFLQGCPLPANTVCCDSVKLIEKVE